MKSDVIEIACGLYSAKIDARRGATCFSFMHLPSGSEVYRTPRSDEEYNKNVFLFGNPILFPPNRISGGRFVFEGREYVFPVNEPETSCHLHGKLYSMPFLVRASDASSAEFVFHAKSGEYMGFIHEFRIVRKYSVSDGGLSETVSVTNLSDINMPFFLAFHSTYNISSADNAMLLKMGVGNESVRDKRFLPTGEWRQSALGDKMSSGDGAVLDSGHISAFFEARGDGFNLTNMNTGISVRTVYDKKFGYRMVFKPENADFICIEQQTCAVDCFHLSGDAVNYGLIVIAPGATVSLTTVTSVENTNKSCCQ